MNTRTVILSMALWCGAASAATIAIDSQQGLFTSFAGVETVAISPHSAWEPNHPVNPGDSTTMQRSGSPMPIPVSGARSFSSRPARLRWRPFSTPFDPVRER